MLLALVSLAWAGGPAGSKGSLAWIGSPAPVSEPGEEELLTGDLNFLLEDKSFLFIFGNMFLPSASAKFKIRSKTLVWQKTPKIKKLGLRLWEEIKKLRF